MKKMKTILLTIASLLIAVTANGQNRVYDFPLRYNTDPGFSVGPGSYAGPIKTQSEINQEKIKKLSVVLGQMDLSDNERKTIETLQGIDLQAFFHYFGIGLPGANENSNVMLESSDGYQVAMAAIESRELHVFALKKTSFIGQPIRVKYSKSQKGCPGVLLVRVLGADKKGTSKINLNEFDKKTQDWISENVKGARKSK
jgi:hypothetical protein